MAKLIWTQDMRREMYKRLLKTVGPHSSWTGSRSPLSKKVQFKDVLSELASEFTHLTGSVIKPSAVEQQIDWGITVQKEMQNQSHVRTFILNKAAALEAGFLTSTDLPEYLSVRRIKTLST